MRPKQSVERLRREVVKTITVLPCLVGLSILLGSPVRPGAAEEAGNQPASRYEMPERLRRQVAPMPSTPWQAPDLSGYASVLKSTEPPVIDPQKRYDLVELIDLAQRLNPETRVAWERTRQAAIAVGLVESEYFP